MSASVTEPVILEVRGEVALVTLNRPERRNALDSEAARAVASAIDEASRGARALILTGAGDAFCAGGDLEELQHWSTLAPSKISAALYESFQAMIRSLRSSPCVCIAAINGAAVGAGLDLALACDLRVADVEAKLGQVWVRLGVIPGTGGAWFTQALAGPTKAAELLLTGDIISAQEALDAGIVNQVAAPGASLDEARALADRVLRNPRDGVIANKRALVAATEPFVAAALAHAAEVQPQRFTSEEFRTALRARRAR